jgi:isoleucyl-tRNA synthetase
METVALAVEGKGIQAWWDFSAEELLGDEAADYEKVTDTLDVWFDSGVTHSFVVDRRDDIPASADLYLEGSDQHRGWFMSSLMSSVAMHGHAPYKQVLTHGFTVDQHGRKMSKSVGNVVAPQEVFNKYGADILRLWVASTDYRSEIAVSDEILKRSADAYRRIRNTARFLLANLSGFNPATDCVAPEDMVALDSWAMAKAQTTQNEIIAAYEKYDLLVVTQKLMQFCSIDMGSLYLDIIKDRQYTAKADGLARRSCQTALYHIVQAMVRWMAPITSFTAQEIWEVLPQAEQNSEPFVFTGTWYDAWPTASAKEGYDDAFWGDVLHVKDAVNGALEQARKDEVLGGSLEADVTIYVDDTLAGQLAKLSDELRFVLITSTAKVASLTDKPADAAATGMDNVFVKVTKSSGEKCVRCWHHREDVGTLAAHPELCGRCVENVDGAGEARAFA